MKEKFNFWISLGGIVFIIVAGVLLIRNIFWTPAAESLKSRTYSVEFTDPGYFTYDVTKVSVDKAGARTLDNNSETELILLDAVDIPKDSRLQSFKEQADVPSGSAVSYQFSTDYLHWYYFNGTSWAQADPGCKICNNSAEEVNSQINKLQLPFDGMLIKVFLKSGAEGAPLLHDLAITTAGETAREAILGALKDLRRMAASLFTRYALAKPGPGPVCGNGNVEGNEQCDPPGSACQSGNNPGICTFDCRCNQQFCQNCGDDVCDAATGENKQNCSQDCEDPVCGNHACEPGESGHGHDLCPEDCPEECDYDGACEPPGEDNNKCTDCQGTNDTCGNALCQGGENGNNCPADCCGLISNLPQANDDSATVLQNMPVSVDVLLNDSAASGRTLVPSSVAVTTDPASGTITNIDPTTGVITYSPNPGFWGTDAFVYKVCDNLGSCDDALVTVTVKALPVANDDARTTVKNTPVTIDILANDTDPDGTIDKSTVIITQNPANGAITNISLITGEVTYTPGADFTGADSFKYTVKDNEGFTSNEATVTITINAAPLPPIANNDSAATQKNTPVTVDVLGNDSDPDGTLDKSTVTITKDPKHGTITNINTTTGEVTYTPDPGYVGADYFKYTVKDSTGLTSNEAKVNITVSAGPLPPIANDDSAITQKNTPVTVDVLGNDSDPDGTLDKSTVTITKDPKHGTITNINTTTGEVTYTPDPGYVGADYFKYTVKDSTGLTSNEARVNITVNPGLIPPVAVDDLAATFKNTPVIIDILANDSDPDGTLDKSSVTIVIDPSHGAITNINTTTGEVTYAPDSGYFGEDTFQYEVKDNDGLTSNAAIVTVKVQAPPAAVDDFASTVVDAPVTIDVLANDSDADGLLNPHTVTLVSIPAHGQITSISPINGQMTYKPDRGYFGTDTFQYKVKDNDGLWSNVATVTVTVKSPPIANDDGWIETNKSTPVTIDILANDVDPDGTLDNSSVTIINDPKKGTITNIDPITGKVTYQPNGDQQGEDNFEYTVKDNDGLVSNEATVKIKISEKLLPPVANDDTASTIKNTPVDIDVLANDSAPSGTLDKSTVTITQNPSHGTLAIDPATGVITYTPYADFTGTDSFKYTVKDSNGMTSNKATVTIGVSVALVPPIANNDLASTTVNSSVIINILANDSDPDGSLVPSSVVTTPFPNTSHGKIIDINVTTGAVTYMPDTEFIGSDTFQYTVKDNDGLISNLATVIINIQGGGGHRYPPVAVDDSASTKIDTPVVIDVLANDSDPDGQVVPSSVAVIIPPSLPQDTPPVKTPHGTITNFDKTTGKITYEPDVGFLGTDQFDYMIKDNDNLTAGAKVTVEVKAGMKARNDTASTPQDTPVTIDVLVNDTPSPNNSIVPGTTKITVNPTNGIISSINPDNGTITYTPNSGFVGADAFNYEVCDTSGDCDTALVTVNVGGGGGGGGKLPPVAIDDFAATLIDKPVTLNLLGNDYDPDGQLVPDTLKIITGPANGTVSLGTAAPSEVVAISTLTGQALYTPKSAFFGLDTFKYEICDNDGLCDSALATILVKAPPIANDDAATTLINTPVTIFVLANDFDPDGFIVPSSLTKISDPSNGAVTKIDSVTGAVTYAPNPGFSATDTFVYKVCDNDFLCDTATVSVTITPPLPPPLPPLPTLAPPIVPPITLLPPPTPTVTTSIGIICAEPIRYTPNVTFFGSVVATPQSIDHLEWSLSNALSWNTIPARLDFVGTRADFAVPLFDLQGGDYSLIIRAMNADGTSMASLPCRFRVASELIFGANQFTLSSEVAPMSSDGVVHFVVGKPQKIYLEARGATIAQIINMETGEKYDLKYDADLKLWTGDIVFQKPGAYRLEGFIANSASSYRREINTAFVSEESGITYLGPEAARRSTITVYEKDAASGRFSAWNGSAYGQTNPFDVEKYFSVILPPGEFYLKITSSGYSSATSLITTVERQSVATAAITLVPQGGFVSDLMSRLTSVAQSFPLIITPMPERVSPQINQIMPNIQVQTSENQLVNLFGEETKPIVLMVYSAWNTLAQEQIDIFTKAAAKLRDLAKFIPLSTLEPVDLTTGQIKRGDYEMNFYKPTNKFFDDYMIIGLPQFFIMGQDQKLLGVIVGSQSEESLFTKINQLIK